MAQLVKNLPAMQKTWVRSLSWKDPLEKGKATHSSIPAWRIAWTVSPWGLTESDRPDPLSLSFFRAVVSGKSTLNMPEEKAFLRK